MTGVLEGHCLDPRLGLKIGDLGEVVWATKEEGLDWDRRTWDSEWFTKGGVRGKHTPGGSCLR